MARHEGQKRCDFHQNQRLGVLYILAEALRLRLAQILSPIVLLNNWIWCKRRRRHLPDFIEWKARYGSFCDSHPQGIAT